MSRKAFTLVELIVVLLILGIISVVGMIAINPHQGIRLDAATKKVMADLDYARNLSLATAKWYGVSFEADPVNSYRIYQTDGLTDTMIDDPSHPGQGFTVDLNSYFSGVKIQSVNLAGGAKVEFNPLGIPYNDKTGTAFGVNGVITLLFGNLTKTAQITPNTGRIFVQ